MHAYVLSRIKNRVITPFNFKVCSPPGSSKSFMLYACMFYLHTICECETGSRGGEGWETYVKIKNGDDPILLNF